MNATKARKLRKKLGMTIHNLRSPEYNKIVYPEKIVYFRNKNGQLVAVKTKRFTVINTSKLFYRQQKKKRK